MKKALNIALVPLTSTDDVDANLQAIFSQLSKFENTDEPAPDLICFPENSLYFNFNKNLNKDDALDLSHIAFARLSAWAVKHKSYLHMGAVPLKEAGTVYNTSVLCSPDGKIEAIYRKIHLFDVDVEGRSVRESLSFDAGSLPAILDIKGWKIGLSICYDVRFAELFVHYHKQQVDLILVPAAFLVPTGRAHWHTLLRARAIETQAFIAATGQVGTHYSELYPETSPKETWGQSLIFDPWGRELGATLSFDQKQEMDGLGGYTGVMPYLTQGEPLKVFTGPGSQQEPPLWSELDPTLIQTTRAQIPLLSHRKI